MSYRKDTTAEQNDRETRVALIQYRAATAEDKGPGKVEMYAAKYNKQSEKLWDFYEVFEPGCFADALTDSDIRALVNHDPNLVLARNTSGTLVIQDNDTGLLCSFGLPDTSYARDLAESMARGDISQCSIAFTIAEDEWIYNSQESFWLRKIHKVKRLYDVSVVTYPAYPDTEASLRSKPSEGSNPESDTRHDEFITNQNWLLYMAAAQQ